MPRPGPKMTLPTQLVLRALLDHPAPLYGRQVCEATGLPSGTVHPILARLEAAGWIASTWEQANPREEGRPRRRYYQFSQGGVEQARRAFAGATTRIGAFRVAGNAGLATAPPGPEPPATLPTTHPDGFCRGCEEPPGWCTCATTVTTAEEDADV